MSKYSYQLYSSRKFGPLHETLGMLAETGYAHVECFGALLSDPDLALGLSDTGLGMPTAHVNLETVEAEPGRVIALAKRLGVGQLYAPYLMPGERPSTSQGWAGFGRRLAAAGRPLFDAGLGFGWHNHDFEFHACDDGRMPITCIMEADERLLLELDVAWVQAAGGDPLHWISHFTGRIGAVHIKDIAPEGCCEDEDGWADIGYGVMNWKTLLAAIGDAPHICRVVEHDNPSDDQRFAERSLSSIRAMEEEAQ